MCQKSLQRTAGLQPENEGSEADGAYTHAPGGVPYSRSVLRAIADRLSAPFAKAEALPMGEQRGLRYLVRGVERMEQYGRTDLA